MLNIILFGPPGAGKGTQGARIVEKYNLAHLSTGDILRAEREAGTELGKYADQFIERGDLVPDDTMIQMLVNKIDSYAGKAGFIFDGFPRSIPQAEALVSIMQGRKEPISCMVMLEVPDETLQERLEERAKKQNRKDDTPEVIAHRIQTYNQKTLPVAGFFDTKGKLHRVNGVGTEEEVFDRICQVLDKTLATA